MRRLILLGALIALLPAPATAQQTVRLWELSTGISDVEGADYVILRIVDGCSLDGLALVVEDAAGVSQGCYVRFEGPPPVTDGYILVGSDGVEEATGLAPDFLADCAGLVRESGRLCLVDPGGFLDCVAWGQFTGDNGSWGAPVDGLQPPQSLTRNQNTGVNVIDWQRSADSAPENLLGNRILPPGGVVCSTDGGSGGSDGGGGLDPTYLEFPGGGLCPTSTFGGGGTGVDGGTTDGGGGTPDAGSGGGPGGGGGSQPYVPGGCGCGSAGAPAGVGLLALGLLLLLGLPGRRRSRG